MGNLHILDGFVESLNESFDYGRIYLGRSYSTIFTSLLFAHHFLPDQAIQDRNNKYSKKHGRVSSLALILVLTGGFIL